MAKKSTKLVASSKAIDPTLDALFASSSGPVQAPPKSRYAALSETKKARDESKPAKEASTNGGEEAEEEEDDEELSEASEELDYGDDDDEDDDEDDEDASSSDDDDQQDASSSDDDESNGDDEAIVKPVDAAMTELEEQDAEASQEEKPRRERKRKRKNDNEELEAKYLAELTKDDDSKQPRGKRQKSAADTTAGEQGGEKSDEANPTHEGLSKDPKNADEDIEKANRTVFLANVSIDAISSKSAKKTLIAHLSSALDRSETPAQKFESIRFRSVAFSTGSMPKRAAYITKSVMGATSKCTNAYAVFSTPSAARQVAAKLNGTEVLGRHIRVDSVAHPSPTDHRRCVFVGNLGFVDDETVVATNKDGENVEKKRTKVPADAEEGLWRTFGKAGKVENVRVVRDSKTRVGKGFAYVQFYDTNDVEAALLLNGKKSPPLLPRILRVTRAKDPRKTALAQERSRSKAQAADRQARTTKYTPKMTPEQQAAAGRASKLLGRAGAFKHRKNASGRTTRDGSPSSAAQPPQALVFEGNRASANDGRPRDLKFGKGKGKGKGRPQTKPRNRSARRAAEWKGKS